MLVRNIQNEELHIVFFAYSIHALSLLHHLLEESMNTHIDNCEGKIGGGNTYTNKYVTHSNNPLRISFPSSSSLSALTSILWNLNPSHTRLLSSLWCWSKVWQIAPLSWYNSLDTPTSILARGRLGPTRALWFKSQAIPSRGRWQISPSFVLSFRHLDLWQICWPCFLLVFLCFL